MSTIRILLIGIAIYPANGETADFLLKDTDIAMNKAKGSGSRVVLFRDSVYTDLRTDSSVACTVNNSSGRRLIIERFDYATNMGRGLSSDNTYRGSNERGRPGT